MKRLVALAVLSAVAAAVVNADTGGSETCRWTDSGSCTSDPCPGTDAALFTQCLADRPPCAADCIEKPVDNGGPSLCAMPAAGTAPLDGETLATTLECLNSTGPLTDACGTAIVETWAALGCDTACQSDFFGAGERGETCRAVTTETACEATSVPCDGSGGAATPAAAPTSTTGDNELCRWLEVGACTDDPCPGTDAFLLQQCLVDRPPCSAECIEKPVDGGLTLCALPAAGNTPLDQNATALALECFDAEGPTTSVCSEAIRAHITALGCDDACQTELFDGGARGDLCRAATTEEACAATPVPCDGSVPVGGTNVTTGPPPSGQGVDDQGRDLGFCYSAVASGTPRCWSPLCEGDPGAAWTKCVLSQPPCGTECAEKPVAGSTSLKICVLPGFGDTPIDGELARSFVNCFAGAQEGTNECQAVIAEYMVATGCLEQCRETFLARWPRNTPCRAIDDAAVPVDPATCNATSIDAVCPNFPPPGSAPAPATTPPPPPFPPPPTSVPIGGTNDTTPDDVAPEPTGGTGDGDTSGSQSGGQPPNTVDSLTTVESASGALGISYTIGAAFAAAAAGALL